MSPSRSPASEHYLLSCSGCGVTGAAEFWTTAGGWSLSGRKAWGLNVSYGFVRGPESIHGRPLMCRACRIVAEITTIDYQEFFSGDRPDMRPVAGSNREPPHINASAIPAANGALFPSSPGQT